MQTNLYRNMKLLSFYILLFFFVTLSFFSQEGLIQTKKIDSTSITPIRSYWNSKNTVGLDLSEIAFVNWNAGGNSSVSGLLGGNFVRTYDDKNSKWNNELIMRYGVNKQDGIELRKTDDAFQFTSTYGYRKDSLSRWFSSAKFNFNTQFTNGYNYPNTDKSISSFLAPAYMFLGVGSEYVDKKNKFTVYMSPLTTKSTFVLNQRLANEGAFGVDKAILDADGNIIKKGRQSRIELGTLVTAAYKFKIVKNINVENRLSLYSDYINNFGNIDVDWQMQMDFVVNEYVKANIGIHMIYDDDIKTKDQVNGEQVILGPKLQIKQTLGIGVVYNFKV
ncbi:MAG: hypothetical protein ACI9XR_000696 [Flavobacterium sp.]